MTWGNNGAGPLGVPPIGPPASVNSPMIGQQGNAYPPFYLASFESIYAAMCRGEIPANIGMAVSGLNGVGPTANQTTLLQAMSQGVPQNGTNGLGVSAGPKPGEGNGGMGGSVNAGSGIAATAFGGTQIVDSKQMANVPALSNPIQYGGN